MPPAFSETVLPNGMKLFCLSEREAQLFYEQVQAYFMNGVKLREGDTVFDAGANIGVFTLLVHERCNRNAVVYAFEPIPVVSQVLQRNAQRYGPEDLRVFPYGLASRCGTTTFTYYPNATGLSTAYPDRQEVLRRKMRVFHSMIERSPLFSRDVDDSLPPHLGARLRRVRALLILRDLFRSEPVTCQVVTLSHVITKYDVKRIDLLKMDVEKSELDVLHGIGDQDWPKIRQVVMEVHEENHLLQKVMALLKARGFNRIIIEQDPDTEALGCFIVYALRSE